METIISASAVVLDEIENPPRIHLFHTNNEYTANGDISQPAGWKLPGGRYEKPRDRTPRHAARNETLLEIGIQTRLGKFFPNSRYGEALRETKTGNENGTSVRLEVYTFLMKRTNQNRVRSIENNEGSFNGSASLKDILLLPLARDIKTGKYNSYGIQFSARKRIFVALHKAGYDFLKLIPDLSEFFDELDPDEVGDKVYWILLDALNEEKIIQKEIPATPECKKGCDCDACWRRFAEN